MSENASGRGGGQRLSIRWNVSDCVAGNALIQHIKQLDRAANSYSVEFIWFQRRPKIFPNALPDDWPSDFLDSGAFSDGLSAEASAGLTGGGGGNSVPADSAFGATDAALSGAFGAGGAV